MGAERRRRWSDDQKLEILAEVARNGWSVADVARRHDLTRQHIYQWRLELRRKQLCPRADASAFLAVEMSETRNTPSTTIMEPSEVTVELRNRRQIRCASDIGEDALARLIRAVEAA